MGEQEEEGGGGERGERRESGGGWEEARPRPPPTKPLARSLVFPSLLLFFFSLHQQATLGDVTGERPMWAERGGLDFDGRARWDAWAGRKGGRAERARAEFVKAFWEASPKAFYSDGRGAFVKK